MKVFLVKTHLGQNISVVGFNLWERIEGQSSPYL